MNSLLRVIALVLCAPLCTGCVDSYVGVARLSLNAFLEDCSPGTVRTSIHADKTPIRTMEITCERKEDKKP